MNKKVLTVVGCACGITLFWVGLFVIMRQTGRLKINRPLVAMIDEAIVKLGKGAEITSVIPRKNIDMTLDNEEYMIIINERGEVAAGSIRLEGITPIPPKGVLDYAKDRGINRVAWQPKKGIRSAIVVKPYPHGWILAGRSLKEVETEEKNWMKVLGIFWAGTMTAGWLVIKKGIVKLG